MSGYSAQGGFPQGFGDGSPLSPIERYALNRDTRAARRETYLLQASGATAPRIPNPDKTLFTTDSLPVAVECWQAYPVTPGATGTVSVYHDSDDDSGLASLVLDVTNPNPVTIPGMGGGQNNPRWFVVNNSTVPVVVVLLWRSWS